MSAVISTAPKGRNFVRALGLSAQGGTGDSQYVMDVATSRWGSHAADAIVRAVTTPVNLAEAGTDAASREFMDLVRERSVYGRLAGLRKRPLETRMLRISSGATGYWVGEAKPKPISKTVLDEASALQPAKVAAIVVLTDESLRLGNAATEAAVQQDLLQAVVGSWDEAFLDVANAGEAGVRPPSITYGAPSIAATGNPTADIAALVSAFQGDFSEAYFITDPVTAMQLAMLRSGDSFQFPDVGPRGGTILGIPLLTSRTSPRTTTGQIALVDPTGIAASDEGLRIQKSQHSSIQMADDPVDGDAVLVSLWQNNLTAFKSEIYTNWQVQRPGSVAVLTGADYPASP